MKRVCFVGDSQIMSLIRAVDAGMLSDREESIHFFGAQGPKFRQLRMVDGHIIPEESAIDNVKTISGGRSQLRPGDFDAFVFLGGRLRFSNIMFPLMHYRATDDLFLSHAVEAEMISSWFAHSRNFRFGRDFAKAGAKVVVVPEAFLIEGFNSADATGYPNYQGATWEDYDEVVSAMLVLAARQGVGFVTQPKETLSSMLFTDPDFAIEGAFEKKDGGHKNEAFANLIARSALNELMRMA
ncbi:hypothetical protein [Actibacterium pelagium]|uniref:hypothetical protein n=1 Tax=Actibacterium pelagium TaxID=2029103 RepID=UPI001303F5B6|nr:hypothetical protein [Actibacterium pelagium]